MPQSSREPINLWFILNKVYHIGYRFNPKGFPYHSTVSRLHKSELIRTLLSQPESSKNAHKLLIAVRHEILKNPIFMHLVSGLLNVLAYKVIENFLSKLTRFSTSFQFSGTCSEMPIYTPSYPVPRRVIRRSWLAMPKMHINHMIEWIWNIWYNAYEKYDIILKFGPTWRACLFVQQRIVAK